MVLNPNNNLLPDPLISAELPPGVQPGAPPPPMGQPNGNGFGSALDDSYSGNDVSRIAAEYASQSNPLMQRAGTAGRQFANERGLLNSSMAAQASQNAVLDRVIPMAQQTSQQRSEVALSTQQFGQAQDLSRQEAGQNFAAQQDAQSAQLNIANLDAATRMELQDRETASRERMAQMDLDQDDRTNMTSQVSDYNQQYQEALRTILGNPEIGASDRNALLKSAGDLLNNQVAMIESLYNFEINWGGSSISVIPQ